ncbi:unnamed protein product [Bursaphelenchus okinawaensis]|uniref:Uncharacterized protein n=1 Tax=Bursaphelenchus okinawaensis TaxID=465554 RepID=A0A811KST5_9BILA|nr:unnamed protein product [Bursaphelenchus okinawaensis]CAG9110073.1 unnamed protein product [Bursaphelenchus okinawaensis]
MYFSAPSQHQPSPNQPLRSHRPIFETPHDGLYEAPHKIISDIDPLRLNPPPEFVNHLNPPLVNTNQFNPPLATNQFNPPIMNTNPLNQPLTNNMNPPPMDVNRHNPSPMNTNHQNQPMNNIGPLRDAPAFMEKADLPPRILQPPVELPYPQQLRFNLRKRKR